MESSYREHRLVALIEKCQKEEYFPNTEEQAEIEFDKFQTNAAGIRHYYKILRDNNMLPNPCEFKIQKDAVTADMVRSRGKQEFEINPNCITTLESLNESLCLAPQGSEVLGLAYADRSEIYEESFLYDRALENIELALANNYPEEMKSGLENRKKKILDLKRIDSHTERMLYDSNEEIKLSGTKHPKIPFIADCLYWAHNDEIGRHIVTTRDLKPGEILVLEEPFITAPRRLLQFAGCYNCTKQNFFNLIPCPDSTSAMFCSEACRQKAWDSYYRYECPIIDGIFNWGEPFAVRATFKALTLFKDRTEFKQLLVQGSENPFNYNFERIDECTKFRIFNSMSTNEDQRSKMKILYIMCCCAVVYHMVKECTELKEEFSKDNELEDVFLELLMRFYQIDEVNNFNVPEPFRTTQKPVKRFSLDAIAQGNYVLSFLFGHSCAPNACFFPANLRGKLGIVTLHPIKAGKPVFISYGLHFQRHARGDRQSYLKKVYHFDCRCEACADEERFPRQSEFKIKLPQDLMNAIKKIGPPFDQFDEETQACATRVKEDLSKLTSEIYDQYYPCKDIHYYDDWIHDVLLLTVFKKPTDLVFKKRSNVPSNPEPYSETQE